MHHPLRITLLRPSGAGQTARRAGTLAAALLGAAGASATAAQAAPTVAVQGDSVLITNHDSGPTTVRATRPDALTHKPVVIGQYADDAFAYTPFSVNTTVPSPAKPNGDCWQKGALASALTPDLQPGDTVIVTQTPQLGQPTSVSVPITAADVDGAVGPIPACDEIAPFARNLVTRRPDRVAGGPIALSGVAQPFAQRVSVSATDGSVSTAPVAASPAQNGTWSAAIPAGQVDRLARGSLRVTPVFEVPDVSTGATAHIAGAAVQVSKSGAGGSSHSPSVRRLGAVRVPGRLGLGFARRKGIRVSFVVRAGARVVRVQLKQRRKVLLQRVVRARSAGSRQTVRLRGPRLRRVLHRGKFRVTVSSGASVDQLGPRVVRAIVIH